MSHLYDILAGVRSKFFQPVPSDIVYAGAIDDTFSGSVKLGLSRRSIDISLALCALLFFLPVIMLLALALLIQDGRPIIYKSPRIGRGGRKFACYKFRSMCRHSDDLLKKLMETDEAINREWSTTEKLRIDPRIHRVGSWLRRSSLDELPQLFNVLRGDMSIVGPRPILEDEVPRYGAYINTYMRVRPGITGLWQVSGRNELSYERRLALVAHYVENRSIALDLMIIYKTIGVVLTGRGAY